MIYTRRSLFPLLVLSLLLPLLFFGCSGDDGATGPPGPAAPTTGNLAGTVTDNVSNPIAGVAVTVKDTANPPNTVATAATDASGHYSVADLTLGTYTVTFAKNGFTPPGGILLGIIAGQTITVNATMNPNGGLSVAITGYNPGIGYSAPSGASDDFGYGGTASLAASATDSRGYALTYQWSNATAPAIGGSVSGTDTTGTVTFPTLAQAMAPRIDTANGNATISGYNYLDNDIGRFGILPILPDTRGTLSIKVTVTNAAGQTASASISLNAASVLTGARNVAKGTRVYLNRGNDNASETWTLAAKPASSTAALDNTTSRTPSFVADLGGTYTITTNGGKSITISAGTFVGVIDAAGASTTGYTFGKEGACTNCHNDIIADDEFTPWYGTAHAKIFTIGVTGGDGTSGASCLTCHTVGFDRGVAAGGFDDLAIAAGWTFPARTATAWTDMVSKFPTVAKLANIQCENCHGPQSSPAHMSTGSVNPGIPNNTFASDRISFSAEFCATCHASGAGHNLYSQWANSPHSNRELALGEGTSTNCGRCHGAQGFTAFVDMLEEGNVGPINNIQFSGYSNDNVFTSSVNKTNVEPQTCTACHDPHDASNPNQLRVFDTVPKTLAGFAVAGFGKGAVCTLCHSEGRSGQMWNVNASNDNTQTFLHEDAITGGLPPQTTSPPHISAITDVLVGRNVYFMGSSIPMGSKHLAVENVCVGCHMELNPKTHLSHGALAHDSHRFSIEDEDRAKVCANCHSASVNGDAIIAAVQAGIDALDAKMGAEMLTKLNSYGATLINISGGSGASAFNDNVAGSAFTSADFAANLGTSRPPGTTFTLVFGATTRNVSLANITLAVGGTQIFPNSSNMMKAIWNYGIVFAGGGGPKCVHNPSFVQAVLNNTLAEDLKL